MRVIITVVFSLLLMLALSNCSTDNRNKVYDLLTDSTLIRVDSTIQNVKIDNEVFDIKILRYKYKNNFNDFKESDVEDNSMQPISLLISKPTTRDPMFYQRFETEPGDYPYIRYSIYKKDGIDLSKSGKLFLMINESYGGSGSGSTRYYFYYENGKINIKKLFHTSGELDLVFHSKNDQDIILLRGIWEKGEGHFDKHKYELIRYNIDYGTVREYKIGITKNKYNCMPEDPNALFDEIFQNEASLFDNSKE